ncbi:hypothetical protein PGQ11_000036 [Apiospora arundinis]
MHALIGNVRHDDAPARLARDPHADGVLAEPAGLLKEVVLLPRRGPPRPAVVHADLERRDGHVGPEDLHAEPPGRRALLVAQPQRRATDAAGHVRVRDVDDALGEVCELGEGVLEEVKTGGLAGRAYVDDLGKGGVAVGACCQLWPRKVIDGVVPVIHIFHARGVMLDLNRNVLFILLTMAVTDFPFELDTLTHSPQWYDVSHTLADSAVPKTPSGSL